MYYAIIYCVWEILNAQGGTKWASSLPRSGKTQRGIAYRLKASTVLLTVGVGENYMTA